ncbi:efflux RND transporter periplasmic adaptor subunit [Massilia sp. 9096]|uniref:efflux RND transporter periplasmic adaptor subunit n=1 Tax=Massilia sp. 9096 TaxID=1500894 RepID=UPI000AF6C00B|nr:efflux RND transporter periplasmic adaptor subunit [Massilia sp. 9096]
MDQIPPPAVTGAAMDAIVPRRRGRLALHIAIGAIAVAALGWTGWQFVPHGLQVASRDVRIARVEPGVFLDDIVVRASAEPLNSIILDSVESGRVEEVLARDGQAVKKGDLLFRLSNPQRNLELLARQQEHAQQISNLANLQMAQEAGRTDHQRRVADLEFALEQAEKAHARNGRLAAKGFISQVALEESVDKLAQQRRVLAEEKRAMDTEEQVRGRALRQMESAIGGLQAGLRLVGATVDALTVRAPADGTLTDFHLQVGETVKTDQRIGRIDDPQRFKLSAQIDEFYLSRVAVGRHGNVQQDGKTYQLRVATVYPQIKDGRFTAEMVFTQGQPEVISPGQSMDAQLTLGEPAKALLLPSGAFVNDSGGAWVFVLGVGDRFDKRPVRLGRRNNAQVEVLSGLAAGDRVIISSYTPFGKAERLQLTN